MSEVPHLKLSSLGAAEPRYRLRGVGGKTGHYPQILGIDKRQYYPQILGIGKRRVLNVEYPPT